MGEIVFIRGREEEIGGSADAEGGMQRHRFIDGAPSPRTFAASSRASSIVRGRGGGYLFGFYCWYSHYGNLNRQR